jgi:hypothetical protein
MFGCWSPSRTPSSDHAEGGLPFVTNPCVIRKATVGMRGRASRLQANEIAIRCAIGTADQLSGDHLGFGAVIADGKPSAAFAPGERIDAVVASSPPNRSRGADSPPGGASRTAHTGRDGRLLITVAAVVGVINRYAGGNPIARTAVVVAPGALVMALIYAWGHSPASTSIPR